MAINWVKASGKSYGVQADVIVSYSVGRKSQFAFAFMQGAVAVKFKNTERLMVGFNDSMTRLYFCPTEDRSGYKVTTKNASCRSYMFIGEAKLYKTYPTFKPSMLIGTYDLKYDEQEQLYYISIGALPR